MELYPPSTSGVQGADPPAQGMGPDVPSDFVIISAEEANSAMVECDHETMSHYRLEAIKQSISDFCEKKVSINDVIKAIVDTTTLAVDTALGF
jgi:hypothetical protein